MTNPVTVTRTETHWELSSAGEAYVLVQSPRTTTWWLYTKGQEHSLELVWDGWDTSEAEALGHAIACVAYNP